MFNCCVHILLPHTVQKVGWVRISEASQDIRWTCVEDFCFCSCIASISCVASVILCLSSCRSMVISFPFSATIQPGLQRDHQQGCLPMAVRAGGKQSVYLEAAWSCCSAWLKGGHLTKLSFGIAGSLVCLVVILLRLRILFSCESHLLFR